MNWFLIALSAPFLWSLVNHFDKYVLEKYLKGRGVGSLILFSCLFGIVLLPIIYFFIEPNVFTISHLHALTLWAMGIFTAISIVLYLYALETEETSIVVPFFQIIPVFGYILGYFLLGEQLTALQVFALVVVVLGAAILSFEFGDGKKIRLKGKVVTLMLTSTFITAITETMFKSIAIKESFWISTFWTSVGLATFGLIAFACIKKYRNDFIYALKVNTRRIIALNMAAESIYIIANILFSYATLLAPIALVLLVNAYQPIFVFAEGVLLTLLFPAIATEKISSKHLVHKIVALAIILAGSYMLYA